MSALGEKLSEFGSIRVPIELLKEALSVFDSCVCLPPQMDINSIIIPIAFALGLVVTLGKLVNFEGRPLIVSYYDCPPLVITRENGTAVAGLEYEVIKLLASKLNFTLDFQPINGTNLWGTEINGTWVGGIVGSIFHGESDIGLCGVWIRHKTVAYMETSAPYAQMSVGFLISKGWGRKEDWKSIYRPFSPGLWLSVFFTAALSALALAFMSSFSLNNQKLLDWVFLVVGQYAGCTSLPSVGPASFRLAGTMVSVGALIVGTLYSSSIVSHLTKPPAEPLPTSIRDLVLRGYLWSRYKPVEDRQNILNIEDEWQAKFMARWRPLSEMGRAIKEKRFAISISYTDDIVMYKEIPKILVSSDKNEVVKLKEPLSNYPIAFGFRKDSPVLPHFSWALNWCIATGVVDKLSKDIAHLLRKAYMERQEVAPPCKPLTLKILQGAFYLLLVGQICSILVFLLEMLSKVTLKKRK